MSIEFKTSPYNIKVISTSDKAYGQSISAYASQHTGKPTSRTSQRQPAPPPPATLYVNLEDKPGEFKLVIRESKALTKVTDALNNQQLPEPVYQDMFVVENTPNWFVVFWWERGEYDLALLKVQTWLIQAGVKTYFCYDQVAA